MSKNLKNIVVLKMNVYVYMGKHMYTSHLVFPQPLHRQNVDVKLMKFAYEKKLGEIAYILGDK